MIPIQHRLFLILPDLLLIPLSLLPMQASLSLSLMQPSLLIMPASLSLSLMRLSLLPMPAGMPPIRRPLFLHIPELRPVHSPFRLLLRPHRPFLFSRLLYPETRRNPAA